MERTDKHSVQVDELASSVLRHLGHVPMATRQAIFDAARTSSPQPAGPLAAYCAKVDDASHSVTDEELAGLAAQGVDEEWLFEATLAVALGAAMRRRERGLAALREAAS